MATERALPALKDLFPEHFFQDPSQITGPPPSQTILPSTSSSRAAFQGPQPGFPPQRRPDTSQLPAKRTFDAFQLEGPVHHDKYVFANEMDEDGLDDDGVDEDGESAEKRRHPCPRCGKRFNRPSSLKIHLNTHTGDKPFECPFPGCGRSFNVSSNMRRHYRNHSRRPPPPPIPTNAYPIVGPSHGPAGTAPWSVRERYRYPHPYPPSPPTPPYTNEPPSPPGGLTAPDHAVWDDGRSDADEMDEMGMDADVDSYGLDEEEYGPGPMHVQELGSGGRGPKGLKWKRDNNWLQFRSILVPVTETCQPTPDTPSMRYLHPAAGDSTNARGVFPAHPQARSHQHPQSHMRRMSSASSASRSSESGGGSGSRGVARSRSGSSANVQAFPPVEPPPSTGYVPVPAPPYPIYTYPPPMPGPGEEEGDEPGVSASRQTRAASKAKGGSARKVPRRVATPDVDPSLR